MYPETYLVEDPDIEVSPIFRHKDTGDFKLDANDDDDGRVDERQYNLYPLKISMSELKKPTIIKNWMKMAKPRSYLPADSVPNSDRNSEHSQHQSFPKTNRESATYTFFQDETKRRISSMIGSSPSFRMLNKTNSDFSRSSHASSNSGKDSRSHSPVVTPSLSSPVGTPTKSDVQHSFKSITSNNFSNEIHFLLKTSAFDTFEEFQNKTVLSTSQYTRSPLKNTKYIRADILKSFEGPVRQISANEN
jgi:hypothetical protein